jgi:sec-independent protein translocase protein TatA
MGLDNPLHLAFIVVILLLVFGARRLPEIGRSLGSGMREFKDSVSGDAKQSTIAPAVQHPQEPVQAPVAQPVAPPAAAAPPAAQPVAPPPASAPVEPQ